MRGDQSNTVHSNHVKSEASHGPTFPVASVRSTSENPRREIGLGAAVAAGRLLSRARAIPILLDGNHVAKTKRRALQQNVMPVFYWGQLMAGALLGSIPVALIYSFFVEHYVAGLTGSIKG